MRFNDAHTSGVAFMALLATVLASLPCFPCQLANNLMVSGSDKPMSYGVGTYGLQKWDAGGSKQVTDFPTVTVSNRVPGANAPLLQDCLCPKGRWRMLASCFGQHWACWESVQVHSRSMRVYLQESQPAEHR